VGTWSRRGAIAIWPKGAERLGRLLFARRKLHSEIGMASTHRRVRCSAELAGCRIVRTIGIARAKAYNIRRLVTLERMAAA
jgi:hypothetical protein